ncbi:MAG TPA: hypothetical protein VFB69_04650 [Candidatus Dormibacteraeota bacterium]|nr:hypothetical protein [Candidatus Dormibacteraeota bacterium]
MKALLVAVAAAALAACGSSSVSYTPSTIVVKEDAAGQTVQAHVGDTVRVQLTESFPVPGSSLTWDVSSSAPSVLKLKQVTRDPAERPRQGTVAYTADFTVLASGEAKLFARGAQTCEAMPSCPQKDFTVTIDAS